MKKKITAKINKAFDKYFDWCEKHNMDPCDLAVIVGGGALACVSFAVGYNLGSMHAVNCFYYAFKDAYVFVPTETGKI